MKQYIKDFGKKEGYDYIYGTGDAATILYSKDSYNITKEVLEKLNKYLWVMWTLASILLMGVKEPFLQIFPISLFVLYCYSKSI